MQVIYLYDKHYQAMISFFFNKYLLQWFSALLMRPDSFTFKFFIGYKKSVPQAPKYLMGFY